MAGIVTREQIAAAVYALVDQAAGSVVGLKTSSRRFRHWDSVTPQEMPALFQIQTPEHYERTLTDGPPKRTMHFEIILYTSDAQANSIVPSTQLNAMIDAIEAAFTPDPLTRMFSLGGLVRHARIEGNVEYFENRAGDGKSLADIQVMVLRP